MISSYRSLFGNYPLTAPLVNPARAKFLFSLVWFFRRGNGAAEVLSDMPGGSGLLLELAAALAAGYRDLAHLARELEQALALRAAEVLELPAHLQAVQALTRARRNRRVPVLELLVLQPPLHQVARHHSVQRPRVQHE